ncbi:MAG TPA: magnesium and cobalt transport protein CorA [Gaiellaceae bacterium]|nr:magnesium and cobalt transport protein CorA [Gaiellaceae bacterium]
MIVDMAVYQDGSRRPGKLKLEDAFEACRDGKSFAWIELQDPSEAEFDSVLREFNLHELAVEDAIQAHQRPKLEVYDEGLLVVLKTARYIEPDARIELGEILVFVGDGFIITVRHGEAALHDVRHRLEKRPQLLRLGPAAALYAIVDDVVDDYGPVIGALEQDIAELEADVFSDERATPPKLIYAMKREVLKLYAAISPLVEPLDRLQQPDLEHIPAELLPYFRDVEDHLIRYMREVEGFRELLTSVLAANLTQISVRQNEDVRKISAWAAIVAVPTLITGIYGMNFTHMPELGWRFGYPLALAAMASVCLFLYTSFRRAGWL